MPPPRNGRRMAWNNTTSWRLDGKIRPHTNLCRRRQGVRGRTAVSPRLSSHEHNDTGGGDHLQHAKRPTWTIKQASMVGQEDKGAAQLVRRSCCNSISLLLRLQTTVYANLEVSQHFKAQTCRSRVEATTWSRFFDQIRDRRTIKRNSLQPR
jgi:hypothetical protein